MVAHESLSQETVDNQIGESAVSDVELGIYLRTQHLAKMLRVECELHLLSGQDFIEQMSEFYDSCHPTKDAGEH